MTVLNHPAVATGLAARPGAGRVVVLGGGGFVGSAIIAALAASGCASVAVQRRPGVFPAGIQAHACDARDARALARVLDGAFGVVNAVRGDARTLIASSIAVAQAARGAGVARMVHISSMDVYGDTSGCVAEAAPLWGRQAYARAKIRSEAAFCGTGAVILRPGLVYGPGGEEWVGRIGRLLQAGRLGDLGVRGDGFCNLVFARDLGAAVVAALHTPLAAGRAINLGMPDPPRWNDFLVAFGRAIGAVPVPRIAGWRLDMEACFLAPRRAMHVRLARPLGRQKATAPEAISPALLGLFARDLVLDVRLAKNLLGVRPTLLAAGLAESAAWFTRVHGAARSSLVKEGPLSPVAWEANSPACLASLPPR